MKSDASRDLMAIALLDLCERFLSVVEKAGAEEPFYRAIHRIADRMAPALRDAFFKGVLATVDQINQRVLISAVETGNIERALSVIPFEAFADSFGAEGEAILLDTLSQAGQAATKPLATTHGVTMSFAVTNPRAQEWAATRTATLVKEVLLGDTGLRDTLRGVISTAFTDGIPPRELAREIRNYVGLLPRDVKAVSNYRVGLEAAGREAGFIERNVERYAQRLLNVRARNIARSETMAASSNGQQELWRQATEQGLLTGREIRFWILTPDSRLCEICEELDGATATMDGNFVTEGGSQTPYFLPPDPHPG